MPSPRLRQRKGHSFFNVLRWRKSIKPEQILALRAIKRNGSPRFVAFASEQLEQAAKIIARPSALGGVAFVPCGSSGPNCLTEQLARKLAKQLKLPLFDAFTNAAPRGSSHPRRNALRPPLKVKQKVDVPVLLIDDVVTSGQHMEEAIALLRKTSPLVLPIALIGD